jgi:Fe2+ transport system protein FeoA
MRNRRERHRHARGRWGKHSPASQASTHETSSQEACLAQVPPGSVVQVDRVHGDEVFRGKMMAMGIVPGVSISVLQGGGGRPLLVALTGSRLILDCRSSELITIRLDGDGCGGGCHGHGHHGHRHGCNEEGYEP